MFDTKIYAGRREKLMKEVGGGLILLLGNEESPMNFEDNCYHFRQDSKFLYFLGLDRPHLAALIDADQGETTIYGEEPTLNHVVWMGPQPGLDEMAARTGAQHSAPYEELSRHLEDAVAAGRTVHYLPPYRPDNKIKLHQWLGIPLDELKGKASVPLIKAVVAQVSIKSEEEIAEIEKAVLITGAMHLAAMRRAKAGMLEAELAGIVEGIAVAAGGQMSFPAIVTINGQTLHNHYHGNELKKGRLLLGDFGAETASHYAGDMTRTFPVDKKFTQKQKDIYNVVLNSQLAALEAIQPGRRYLDVHLSAAKTIAEGLIALGLMSGDAEEAVAAGAHALFFPHGLGHMLGLDVHDMEDLGEDYVGYSDDIKRSDQFGLKSLRLARELQPGFVLTVEPGVYFIPELIKQWREAGKFNEFINYDQLDKWLDFGGVRIEDNVVITSDGSRILGRPVPKTVEEVEEQRKG